MITELEKQFFDTFGIEPHYYCTDEYVFEAMLEYECTEGNREKCKTCKKVGKVYLQITDGQYLELICMVMNIFDGQNVYVNYSVEKVKERTLKLLIIAQDDVYSQVQAIFKGE